MIYAGVIVDPSKSKKETNTTYIDDDALVQISKNPGFITRRLDERMAERVRKAAPLNIKYEPEKSDLIFFRPTFSKLQQPKNHITVAGKEIHPKSWLKYVGVWIDPTLSFRPHIENTIAKGLQVLQRIRILSFQPGATVKTIHHVITQLFLPTILWGSEAWWTGAEHIIRSLTPLYNEAARIVTGLPRWTKQERLLKEAGLPPLELLLTYRSRKYGTRILCLPYDHPIHEPLASLLPAKETNVTGTGLHRIASLLLPFQVLGDVQARWTQTKQLRERMLEEWNTPETINYYRSGTVQPCPKLRKLTLAKARLISRIRCQATKIDRHAAYVEQEPCQCGMENSSRHTLLECPQWDNYRTQLLDKIPGPATWENWMFSNLKVDLILEFAKHTRLLEWYEDMDGREEED